MRLVRQDEHVVVRINGLRLRVVELLDERENKSRIAPEFRDEVRSAGRHELRRLRRTEQTAHLKRLADLVVQLLPIREHHDGGRAGKFPPDFLRKERHGITLARALRMPEDAQLPLPEPPLPIRLHRRVHPEILVIPREDLRRVSARMVEENEIFKKVEKMLRHTHAAEHRLQRHGPRHTLGEAFPLVEKFVPAPHRSHAGLLAVAEHHKGIRMEKLRHRVQIVRVIVRISVRHIHVVPFQLREEERHPVYKAHDVRPPPIQRPPHPELFHREEMIRPGMLEIEHRRAAFLRPPVGARHRHGDALPDEMIFFLIDREKRRRREI